MKCFYVGDFKKPYSTEMYITFALRKLGVEVKAWQQDMNVPLVHLLGRIDLFAPDFVLFCKRGNLQGGPELIHALKQKGILIVTWLFDLYRNIPKEMESNRSLKEFQFSADIVFTSDGGGDWGDINHHVLRQGISDDETTRGHAKTAPDIAFIGTNTYNGRDRLISALKDRYKGNFRHYGIGGTNYEVRGKDLNDLLASTKIVVGDSVPSPHYWSNRIYEVLGRGGFLIHPKVEGLEKEFQYYKHFIPFDYGNYPQLYEIIDYYLTHDAEREKIRKAGHTYTKKNLTYTQRCKILLQEITGMLESRK